MSNRLIPSLYLDSPECLVSESEHHPVVVIAEGVEVVGADFKPDIWFPPRAGLDLK
jgi:hypothetical protein